VVSGTTGPSHRRHTSKAEAALGSGASPTAAAEAELAGAKGYGGNEFKIPLARRIIVSTLAQSKKKSSA
jgi:xanthine dehydrogenase YagS FAD-binding subunit